MPVLSAAPLWSPDQEAYEPVPFTEALLHQHGEEVQCIPYTVSPFSLLDIPKSSEDSTWTIAQYLQVRPSTIKPTLVCQSISLSRPCHLTSTSSQLHLSSSRYISLSTSWDG